MRPVPSLHSSQPSSSFFPVCMSAYSLLNDAILSPASRCPMKRLPCASHKCCASSIFPFIGCGSTRSISRAASPSPTAAAPTGSLGVTAIKLGTAFKAVREIRTRLLPQPRPMSCQGSRLPVLWSCTFDGLVRAEMARAQPSAATKILKDWHTPGGWPGSAARAFRYESHYC